MTRLARFECSCCSASLNVQIDTGKRTPRRRPCVNSGCHACIGACTGMAHLMEVERLPDPRPAQSPSPLPDLVPPWLRSAA